MSGTLLFYLLGVGLLLSQLPRELAAEHVVKLCGRELIRHRIELCGRPRWHRRPRDTSYSNTNTENLNMMLASTPSFQEEVMTNEELRKMIQKSPEEADGSSPELKSLIKLSRKKRNSIMHLSNKCCYQGCTRQELTVIC
ncbi:PREDICTED: prorelaxin H2-like [Chrysochloris asiatica]|uniref:Prorelaxin H2-like n=1 Tax=Chrysochloris asiatica TaxID=185453 RepID=A0A9B0TEC8_CHRAS|nr:PREDICTED: prorelaxin H2-like [Chrysochloris asiatica]